MFPLEKRNGKISGCGTFNCLAGLMRTFKKNFWLICKALTVCFGYFLSRDLYKWNICVPLQPANEEADFLKAETKKKK